MKYVIRTLLCVLFLLAVVGCKKAPVVTPEPATDTPIVAPIVPVAVPAEAPAEAPAPVEKE